MQNVLARDFFKYLFFFFCFFVLAQAGIYGLIFPFAISLCLALVWQKQNLLITLGLFLVSGIITDFSLAQILGLLVFALVIMLTKVVHLRLKKPITFSLFSFYGVVAQSGFLASEIFLNNSLVYPLLSVALSIIFLWVFKPIFGVVFKGGAMKLCGEENFSLLAFIGALSCGLNSVSLFGVELIILFSVPVLLFVSETKSVSNVVLVGATMGIGTTLSLGNPLLIAPFVVWALCVGVLKGAPMVLRALIVVLSDALLGFLVGFYGDYSWIQLAYVALGAFGFCFVPNQTIKKLDTFFGSAVDDAARSAINLSRENLQRRLMGLSEVFGEMDYVFRAMIKGGMTKAEVKHFLTNELREKVCASCPQKNICHRKCMAETQSVFGGLIGAALERGRATLLDAPPFLTTRCGRVANLVGAINDLCAQYRKYASAMNNIDASRILIADELKGLSGILKNLANEVGRNITLDTSRENKIISDLAFWGILCADAVIYEENAEMISATLLVRKTDSGREKIAEVVSRVAGGKMAVTNVENSPRAGFNVITLKTAPRFNLAFGTAAVSKHSEKVSGDAYSIIRISHDKFLLALCDGMGSGEKAEKTSSLAISLVENFYKAGFDNEIILSGVNKLLSLGSEEIFSALDICVLNTFDGTADFIKMGSPESFVKHSGAISLVQGGTLPLGIVQDAEPLIEKKTFSAGDYIFMFTDGVSDSFRSLEEMQDFVNNLTFVNPQMLAEKLLEKALDNSGGVARDDMTVLVCKIFE